MCSLTFQADGNLVIYWNGSPIWQSGTKDKGYYLKFQDKHDYADRLFILSEFGKYLWDS